MTNNYYETQRLEKTNYNAIDVFKFLCAFLVFAIHVEPFVSETFEYTSYLNILTQKYICRIAVPFYFTSSGFFLFKKMDIEKIDFSIINKYCFKILYLFGIWSIILIVSDYGHHLWYLKSLVVSTLLVGGLLKYKIKFRYIMIIAVSLYIIGLLGDSYNQIIKNIGEDNLLGFVVEQYEDFFETTRNGLFMGFIFVLLGAAFSQKKIEIKFAPALLGLVISMGLWLLEVYIVKHFKLSKDTNMYIFVVPTIVFLFSILLKIKLKDRAIYPRLRTIGMLIYYSHMSVYVIVTQIYINIENYYNIDCSNLVFVTTLVITIILAVIVERMAQKEKFKVLQHLYR